MKRNFIRLVAVPVCVVFSFAFSIGISYCIGNWLIAQGNAGKFESWKQIITPPEKASRILEGDASGLFVRVVSASGTAYICYIVRQECWQKTEDISDKRMSPEVSGCSFFSNSSFDPPALPNPTVDEISVNLCEGEIVGQSRYAIDKEGVVWAWTYMDNGFGALGRGFSILGVSFLTGIIIAIWLSVYLSTIMVKNIDRYLSQRNVGR